MVTHCCSTHAIPLSTSPTTAPHLHTSLATLPLTAFHSLSHLSPILLTLSLAPSPPRSILEQGQKKSATLEG